jgi:hypothetical protein
LLEEEKKEIKELLNEKKSLEEISKLQLVH